MGQWGRPLIQSHDLLPETFSSRTLYSTLRLHLRTEW